MLKKIESKSRIPFGIYGFKEAATKLPVVTTGCPSLLQDILVFHKKLDEGYRKVVKVK